MMNFFKKNDNVVFLLLLFTNVLLGQSSVVVLHDFNYGVNQEQNTWADWYIRNDIPWTDGFAWVREDANSYWGAPLDLRPRMLRKNPNSDSVSLAQVTLDERAPGTSFGGCLRVYSGDGATSNDAGWWIWYGGKPISQYMTGIDANTDRLSMYVKFENIVDYQLVHLGTYLSNGAAEEYGNSHYYHYLNPPAGTWLHILIDRHPSHRRDFPGQNAPRNNPALEYYGLEYMPNLIQMYFEIRYSSNSTEKAQYYLDELYFYSTKDTFEPDQNDDSISSVWVGYWPNEGKWEIGFVDESNYYGEPGRGEKSWATYEVRWSLLPITNENWNQATPIQNTTFNDGLSVGQFRTADSWRSPVKTRFTIPSLPENTKQIYFAIKDISKTGEHVGGSAVNGDGRDSLSPYIHSIDYMLMPQKDVFLQPAAPSNLRLLNK